MIEIISFLVYFVLIFFSPTPDDEEYVYPEQLDLRWTKTGQLRIPTSEEQGICGSCWAIASITVFATAVFDARIGQQQRLFRYSEQYLVDCIQRVKESLEGCNGVPPTYAFMLIKKDGLPLSTYYEYKSGGTGLPQPCGLEPKVALGKTKKDGLLYKASQYGTVQGCAQFMDLMASNRIPLISRIFVPPSFHEYVGTFVYDPTTEECEKAEREHDKTIHHYYRIWERGRKGLLANPK
ncbi:hypothetical protein niasHT_006065 [Heterodera trifolii]|uniref:Peptidase C1A papain C-terminal domain-containing protein n=1 Tax=Heterodera trifolii TaxID=157864 RepID=A0ABD2MAH8_9BILA